MDPSGAWGREEDADLSLTAAVKRIGPRVWVNSNTLRESCKSADIDAGRPGTTTEEVKRMRTGT